MRLVVSLQKLLCGYECIYGERIAGDTLKTWKASNCIDLDESLSRIIINLRLSGSVTYFIMILVFVRSNKSSPRSCKDNLQASANCVSNSDWSAATFIILKRITEAHGQAFHYSVDSFTSFWKEVALLKDYLERLPPGDVI